MDQISPSRGRGRFQASITRHDPLCDDHFMLELHLPATPQLGETRAGQFVQLNCAPAEVPLPSSRVIEWGEGRIPRFEQPDLCRPTPLLRRPFSLAGRRDEPDGTYLEVMYRVAGLATRWLVQLQVGQTLDLIGPLGNSFRMPEGRSLGLLVGGGVGLPPMGYLATELAAAGCDACAFVGATTADLLPLAWTDVQVDPTGQPTRCARPFADLGQSVLVTTDDGTCGLKGRITDGLARYLQSMSDEDRRRAAVFTCGPMVMMRAVADLAECYDLPCQVSVEQSMACGMGTCQSCVVRIRDDLTPQGYTPDGVGWRYRLACADGPVFEAGQMIWD
jgi:dihydroorotate dehydrogenase electron transfer subunit